MLCKNLPKARPRAMVIFRIMPSQLSPAIRIALVGMSGTGKTFWAKRLAANGHQSISCDDRIEQRLRPHLPADGYTGTSGVAAWMGWPDSSTYAQRESDYLAAEITALDELLTELERNPSRELVLDTTGSVIYTGNNVLMRLRRQMTIVYLAASAEEQQLLIQRYLTDPKPVLWRGAFQPKNGETPHETVARCYPTLVAARRQSYEALAHCTLPVADLHSLSEKSGETGSDAEAFLERIRSQIEKKSGRANGL
jgi:shikimate kinase